VGSASQLARLAGTPHAETQRTQRKAAASTPKCVSLRASAGIIDTYLVADMSRRLPQNVSGTFFVDDTCIDCDACRQIAPTVFRDHGGQSSVYHQPSRNGELDLALKALITCPTASIGAPGQPAKSAVNAFPERIAENVYFNGYAHRSSFGAWSYLIVRNPGDGGNILIDSPRFASPLVKRIEELGGARLMFLTHQDDVADHERFADHFRLERIMHREDGAARLGVERVIDGEDDVRIDSDMVVIPTPGHTRGHCVLLFRKKFLFTGDHLAWSPERETLTAFRSVAWYSWPEQTRSMRKLLNYQFEWVLPGHGRIHHAPASEMHEHLKWCVDWMKSRR